MEDHPKIAFALGGLAGNNAHGAGFLQAALEAEIDSDMISCTSGQIYWVWRYLRQRDGHETEGDLKTILAQEIAGAQRFHIKDLDLTALALLGKQDVFKPAYTEYLADAIRNAAAALGHVVRERGNVFFLREFLQLFPCRLLVPEFPPEFFAGISDAFNRSEIGIVFNSYNPSDGREYVHMNEAARIKLSTNGSAPYCRDGSRASGARRYTKGERDSYRDRTTYQDITPEAVREGLWIYQYGFDGKEDDFVDGAYFREIILSELTYAATIYVARPIHFHWTGHLPSSYPEMEDLKTKVAFNGSYSGERYQILLINKLLKDGVLPEKYHPIKLVEIEMEKPRGFFDYVFEDLAVFDAARTRTEQAFQREQKQTPVATH
jgi:hypothetical protein